MITEEQSGIVRFTLPDRDMSRQIALVPDDKIAKPCYCIYFDIETLAQSQKDYLIEQVHAWLKSGTYLTMKGEHSSSDVKYFKRFVCRTQMFRNTGCMNASTIDNSQTYVEIALFFNEI